MAFKKWIVKQYDKTLIPALMQKYNVSHLMANLLCSRDLTDEEEIKNIEVR